MIEILSYGFMQRALTAGVIVSVLCALLSFFVILKRLSFTGAGISHSAFGGVAIGILLGWDPLLTAAFFCMLVAVLINWVQRKGTVTEDAAIGIFFAAAMALGVMLLALSNRYNIDLFGYLFGNILTITFSDLLVMAVAAGMIILLLLVFFKELLFYAFDEELARVNGLPTVFLSYLLGLILALAIVASLKVVGIILVSALLVIPGATARQLARNYRQMVLLSVLCALAATMGGLLLSYWWDLPSGATIVLLATFFFLLSLFRPGQLPG